MHKRSIFIWLASILWFNASMLYAQENTNNQDNKNLDTETVTVVKSYTPTVSDAFKIKDTPVIDSTTLTTSEPLQYTINSVPVASTFTPAKVKAERVSKRKPERQFDNYAQVGFGSYTTALAEFFSNFEISRRSQAGLFLSHQSSQNGVEGVLLPQDFYTSRLEGYFRNTQRDATYKLRGGIQHQAINWYGLPTAFDASNPDLWSDINSRQQYFSGFVKGSMLFEEALFRRVEASAQFFSDAFSSSEVHLTASPRFVFPIQDMYFEVTADVDYLSGNFSRTYFEATPIAYQYLNAALIPALTYTSDDLELALGASIYVGLNLENQKNDVYIYPNVLASYRLLDDYLIVSASAKGALTQNSFANFVSDNPFVSPTLQIQPTDNTYAISAGLKGALSSAVSYTLEGSYSNFNQHPFFRLNTFKGVSPAVVSTQIEGYEYGNSFYVVYDALTQLTIRGQLSFTFSKNFDLQLEVASHQYELTQELAPWNLPEFEAAAIAHFRFSDRWFGDIRVFHTGSRMGIRTQGLTSIPMQVDNFTLPAFTDANLQLTHQLNNRLSVFLKGNNVFNNQYMKWGQYPVLGLQVLAGASYAFDW